MDLDAGDFATGRQAIVASDAELLGNQAEDHLRTGSWSSARTPAEVRLLATVLCVTRWVACCCCLSEGTVWVGAAGENQD